MGISDFSETRSENGYRIIIRSISDFISDFLRMYMSVCTISDFYRIYIGDIGNLVSSESS